MILCWRPTSSAAHIDSPPRLSLIGRLGGLGNVLPLSRVRPFARGCATLRVALFEPRTRRASERPHVGSCGELAGRRNLENLHTDVPEFFENLRQIFVRCGGYADRVYRLSSREKGKRKEHAQITS